MARIMAPDDYVNYVQRSKEREDVLTYRIRNLQDPIDALNIFVENEGVNLRAVWESDFGNPVDGVLLCIILIPVFLGVLANYICSIWEPKLIEEEKYDEFGKKFVEYPNLPIAILQQSQQDMSAARENRNSLAWLCHRWLISTNDVVQELQGTYPVEEFQVSGWGTVKALARLYHIFHKVSKRRQLTEKKDNTEETYPPVRRQLVDELKVIRENASEHLRKNPKMQDKLRSVFMNASPSDIRYLRVRLPAARRLWIKLHKWVAEYENRPSETKYVKEDSLDSYWTSSETFSTDSGEHWKNYTGNMRNWIGRKKETADWNLEKARRFEDAVKAEEMRRQAELLAAASETASETTMAEEPRQSKKAAKNVPVKPQKVDKVANKAETGSSKIKKLPTVHPTGTNAKKGPPSVGKQPAKKAPSSKR